jgi:hypothetical protein
MTPQWGVINSKEIDMKTYITKGDPIYQLQDREIQKVLDEIRATVPLGVALRGSVKTNPHRARIRALFQQYRFPPAYETSFWIALAEDIPFHRRLWAKDHIRSQNQ